MANYSWSSGEKKLNYQPTETESKIIETILDKFSAAKTLRDDVYRNFNDRSLVEYVNDSMDRWNGYIEPRTDEAADWGAKVFNNMTRNKVISIVAQTTAERLKGEYFAQSKDDPEDKVAADISKKFNDHAAYINKDEEQQFYSTLECVIKGTVIGFETFKTEKRKIREIKSFDPSTGVVEYDEKEIADWNDVLSDVVPLLDIYIGNFYERDIQKQPFIIWRTVKKMSDAERDWGRFKNWDKVQPGGDISSDDIFKNLISGDVEDDEVEVIRYFCKKDDEMHIIANGVLLTPTISPFPWNHKKYPFWVSRFEPFAIDFFYGRSLPDKLKPDQDIINVLTRMMIDQNYLSINKPIFTTEIEGINDTYMYPGAKIKVDSLESAREFDISGPEQASFNMLKLVQDSVKEASSDDPSSGTSGSNSTAFEVSVAKESATKLLALFITALEFGAQQKLELRLKNQFQFYQMKSVQGLLSKEDQQKFTELRKIRVPNTILRDGSKGTHEINIIQNSDMMPTQEQLDLREYQMAKEGKNVAYSYITCEWLRNLDVMVHIIPNSSMKMSKALERALELDYQAKVMELYPDLVNREESFRELNEKYDKDHEKMMMPAQEVGMPPDGAGVPPGGTQPASREVPIGAPGNKSAMQGSAGSGQAAMGNINRGVIREGAKRA